MRIRHEAKKLFSLTWPILIAQLTQTMMGFIDTVMAGRVSATDMAAVAIASSIWLPIILTLHGLILALPPIVSRLNGSKTYEKIAFSTFQTGWLAFALSIVILVIGQLMPWFFQWFSMEPELKAITVNYLQAVSWGAPAFALYMVLRNYCEGLSITKPAMNISFIGLLVNIPANYIFVYGKFGMPAMGGAGCGVATAMVYWTMFLALIVYTRRSANVRHVSLYERWYKPDFGEIKSIVKLGTPIAFSMLFEVSLFSLVALLIAPFGAVIVAAHQVALNFSSLLFMLPLSLGMATTIRVSHVIGEGDLEHAKQICHAALLIGICLASLNGLVSILFRSEIAAIYTQDIAVIELAAGLMFLAAVFQLSDATQVVCGCALRGYKDTKAMLYITFFAFWIVGLPLGCVLGLTDWIVPAMSAKGFWIGFICALTSAAILLFIRLRYVQRQYAHQPQFQN